MSELFRFENNSSLSTFIHILCNPLGKRTILWLFVATYHPLWVNLTESSVLAEALLPWGHDVSSTQLAAGPGDGNEASVAGWWWWGHPQQPGKWHKETQSKLKNIPNWPLIFSYGWLGLKHVVRSNYRIWSLVMFGIRTPILGVSDFQ